MPDKINTIKDQTTGLLNHCCNVVPPFGQKIIRFRLSVIGSTASASPTSHVVMSEASPLRLTDLKSVSADSWQ
jgi:hypothetical protein